MMIASTILGTTVLLSYSFILHSGLVDRSQLSNMFENSKYETGVQLNNVTSKKADSNIAIYEKTGKIY